MSNNNSKSANEIHEEVARLGEIQDLGEALYRNAAPKIEAVFEAHLCEELDKLVDTKEFEAEDVERLIKGARRRYVSQLSHANDTLFAYKRPSWYLNIAATSLAVVGTQVAVSYGSKWLAKRLEGGGDATRSNPFSETTGTPRPTRLRRPDAPAAAVANLN